MLCWITILGGVLIMMGQHDRSEALFYYFRLEDQVPETHLLRLTRRRRALLHLVRCDQLDIDGIHETGLNGRYETLLLTRAAILGGACSPDVLSRV